VTQMLEEARNISYQATAESYVQSFGKYAEDLIAQLKSPFVTNRDDNEVHKTFKRGCTDCDKRMREVTRHFGGKSSDSSLVANVFEFGRQEVRKPWVFSNNDELDSGSEFVKVDDFCAVVVRTKVPGNTSKMAVMLVGKFLRFGPSNSRVQLQHCWKRDENYRATVLILGTEEYTPASKKLSIRPHISESASVCELVCVDSSCLISISPSSEDVASADSIVPSTVEYILIDDLKDVFSILLLRGKHHDIKNMNILPIKVEGKDVFTGNPQTGGNHAVEVCNICNPPRAITTEKMGETERKRAIRNHMAAHLISQPNPPLGNEPCAYLPWKLSRCCHPY